MTREILIILLVTSVLVREVYLGSKPFNEKFGLFDIIWRHVDDCSNENAPVKFHIRSRRVSRTRLVVEGHVNVIPYQFLNETITEVTDDIKLRSVLQQFTPSGWKDNFVIMDYGETGVCSVVQTFLDPADIERFSKVIIYDQTNQPIKLECPVPIGNYTITGADLNTRIGMKHMPEKFFYGKYRMIMRYHYLDRDHEVACAMVYCDIVPKNRQ